MKTKLKKQESKDYYIKQKELQGRKINKINPRLAVLMFTLPS